MRPLVAALLLLLLVACDVERDLSLERFGCAQGGPCADGGSPADAAPSDAGVPACDPRFGLATACGGDPGGVWSYRAACGSASVLDAVTPNCAGAEHRRTTLSASGVLNLSGSQLLSNCLVQADEALFLPPSCLQVLSCATLNSLVRTANPFATSGCHDEGAGCLCELMASYPCAESGPYTIEANELVVGGTTRYPFCASAGSSLVYVAEPAGAGNVRITYVLTRSGD